jgi:hypothetical protein
MNINREATGIDALKSAVETVADGRYQEYFWAVSALIAYDTDTAVGEAIMRIVMDEETIHEHFINGDSALTAYQSYVNVQ